jgi:hypothetical protein
MNVLKFLIALCAIIFAFSTTPTRAQTLWLLEADGDPLTLRVEDWSIPVATDTIGSQLLAPQSNPGLTASTNSAVGGLAVSKSERGYWITNGIENASAQFEFHFYGINHNHLCASSVPYRQVFAGQWPVIWSQDAHEIRGLCVDALNSIPSCNAIGFLWCLVYIPNSNPTNPNALLRLNLSLPTPLFDAVNYLQRANGNTSPFTDIEFDTQYPRPAGHIWAIDAAGTAEQFAFNVSGTTLPSLGAYSLLTPGPGTPNFVGLALDTSRPMTLPVGGTSATSAGTISGLNSDGTVWTLQGPNLPQENWYVGGLSDYRGFGYSAEMVRIGLACNSCTGAPSNSARIDIAWPVPNGEPQPLVQNTATQPTCQNNFVVVEGCNIQLFTPTTAYLVRSAGYNPTSVPPTPGSFLPCTLYPDTTLGPIVTLVPVPSSPIRQQISVGAWGIPTPPPWTVLDTRVVEYAQWVFICGQNQPFNLALPLELSDACRIAWSAK